jgi:lipopolysaccharide/colanic/teichoic acid biosynthesis glycosyltransferase
LYAQANSMFDPTADYLTASHRRARAKRLFDFSMVLATAPVWLAILAVLCTLVKLSDPAAPAIYWQERTGRLGRRFKLAKIRTMCPGADAMRASLAAVNEATGPDFKIKRDPRVTRIGAILRRTHLDELPQFFNVLTGSMSLVGPRPISTARLEQHHTWWRGRLDAVPGLTGLWQMRRRGICSFEERVRYDISYIRNQSLLGDVRLIFETIIACIQQRGS